MNDLTNQQFAIVMLTLAVAFLMFVAFYEQTPSAACLNLGGEWLHTGTVEQWPDGPTVDTWRCELP